MGRIFLSYAREDRGFAERLARVLENGGHNVWWDRHIDSGREFAGEIETQLEKSDLVLVAWSKAAARSPWVRDEAAIGRDRGRLLPVLIDASRPPIGFRQLQALDLNSWKGRQNDRRSKALLQAVEKVISGGSTEFSEPKPRAAWTHERRWAIAAALALLIASAIGAYLFKMSIAQAEPASLAVLPFKNIAAGDSYFAEGVAEEISNRLSREPQFRVVGRTSASLFKDAADLREVGRRLHVAYVMEGSVRSAGNQVRVDVALVEARKGMRLWSQDFRGSLNDIFAIQDTIGEQVAAHVRKQLVRQALPSAMKTSGDVYSLYLTARALIRTRQPARLHSAIELLRQAIKVDPKYAPAWAQLAQAMRFEWMMSQPTERGFEAARQEWLRIAQHAVRLAPDSADANLAMAFVLSSFSGEDPKYDTLGRAYERRAAQLDPNAPEVWDSIAQGAEIDGDFPRALQAYRRLDQIEPLWWHGYDRLVGLAWSMGYRDEARMVAQRVVGDARPFSGDMVRASLAILQGDWSEALKWIRVARAAGDPSEKGLADNRTAVLMRTLGYFEQARAQFPLYEVDDDLWRMWNGKAPSPQRVAQLARNPVRLWNSTKGYFLFRTLLAEGRSAELVHLYDLRFKSPEELHTTLGEASVEHIIAFRDVGRRAEADRMAKLAQGDLQKIQSHGGVPSDFYYEQSQIFAANGQREKAIAALQKAVKLGWFYNNGPNSFRDLAGEPVFRDIVPDPRFQQIRSYFVAHLAKERRETGPIDG
jgi:TolB-like protein